MDYYYYYYCYYYVNVLKSEDTIEGCIRVLLIDSGDLNIYFFNQGFFNRNLKLI